MFLSFYLNRNFYLAFTEGHTTFNYQVKAVDRFQAPTITICQGHGLSSRTWTWVDCNKSSTVDNTTTTKCNQIGNGAKIIKKWNSCYFNSSKCGLDKQRFGIKVYIKNVLTQKRTQFPVISFEKGIDDHCATININGSTQLGVNDEMRVFLINNTIPTAKRAHYDVYVNNAGEKFHLGSDGYKKFQLDIRNYNAILMKKQQYSLLGRPFSNCLHESAGEQSDMIFRGNYSQVCVFSAFKSILD